MHKSYISWVMKPSESRSLSGLDKQIMENIIAFFPCRLSGAPPFVANSEEKLAELINRGELHLDSSVLQKISDGGK